MKMEMRWRLTLFASAIVLVAVAIVWTARVTWNQVRRLNSQISTVQVQSFEIADHFQATVLDLNLLLRDYQALHHEADWQKFVQESEALDQWIDEQAAQLKNPNEFKILEDINRNYDIYRHDAHDMINQIGSATGATSTSELLRRAEKQSKDLLHLGNKLAKAHREIVTGLMVDTHRSFWIMEEVIFGLLLVLLALGAWVAVVVYRDMIAPLRVSLVETRATMERQEKLASLGILATGLAHEIRNPLTAIKARLFTQQKKLAAGSAEAEDARVINSEINRLDRIVREVLQFARPAEPTLVREPAELSIREVHELMAPQLEKHGIQLKLDALARVNVEIDRQQIKQVLINVVQNAVESIERDGLIQLRVRTGTARLRGTVRPVVILEVEDNGRGIPLEVQKRLFDPFFTTKETGTGLGLSIAARIVEKHGGVLEFQTHLNRGTIFGLMLPQASPA